MDVVLSGRRYGLHLRRRPEKKTGFAIKCVGGDAVGGNVDGDAGLVEPHNDAGA